MEIQPYSIYINHRPFRIAFLVDPADEQGWFDTIFEYNRGKWGGRFNPIIFSDGKTIKEPWWKFIRDYDPDIIYSTIDLSEELKEKINIFLTPLSIESNVIKSQVPYINIDKDPLSILPTQKNISSVANDLFEDKSSIVLFDIDESTPGIIKIFLSRNFGILKDDQMTVYAIKRCLQNCNKKIYKIKDYETLNEALLDLGQYNTRVIFPGQICAIPNSLKSAKYDYQNDNFSIIIGDTPDELAYLWNRTMFLQNWVRTSITQIWLPISLASDERLKSGLGKFINRHAGQIGQNNHSLVKMVSFSVDEDELKKILESFNSAIFQPKKSEKYQELQIPVFRNNQRFFLPRGLEQFRAYSTEQHITVKEPSVEEGAMGGEHWFVDMYIQYRPERFLRIQGVDYWWQLPKRNGLLSDLHFFNKPARINEFGMFSVLMSRRSSVYPDENTIVLKLPDEMHVFNILICGESYKCRGDERQRFFSRPFYFTQRSNVGKYLSGILSLFPDLLSAYSLIEDRYWRKIFEKMSNQNPSKDQIQLTRITNTLKKKIGHGQDLKSERSIVSLSELVLKLAKEHSKEDVELTFEEFKKEAEKETDEYNLVNKNTTPIAFDEGGLSDQVADLISKNILLKGVKSACPHCGSRIWYHIDEVKQQMICKGCGYGFSLNTEEAWYYRLNSMVKSGFAFHGIFPVLLVLGQLLRHDAHSSFLYIPSIDLFQEIKRLDGSKEIKHWGEIDVACIVDGQFVIGEVKQSVSLFKDSDFTKMAELARLLKPDVIIFSSMDKDPNALVKENIEKMRNDLADLEVDVKWYGISYWVLQARPVR